MPSSPRPRKLGTADRLLMTRRACRSGGAESSARRHDAHRSSVTFVSFARIDRERVVSGLYRSDVDASPRRRVDRRRATAKTHWSRAHKQTYRGTASLVRRALRARYRVCARGRAHRRCYVSGAFLKRARGRRRRPPRGARGPRPRGDGDVDVRDEGDDSSRGAMDIASRTYDTSIGSPRSRRVALVRALDRALVRVAAKSSAKSSAMRGARASAVDCRFSLPRQKRKGVKYRDK